MVWLSRSTVLCVVVAVCWKYFSWHSRVRTGLYGGYVHPAFQEVKDTFIKNVESGYEPGASFAVYYKGKPLVDLWGGYADAEAGTPWQENTLTQVWSCTKGLAAVAVAMLVDRGLLDYQQNVGAYWPEFASHGKENITVAMLLSHQAGLVLLGRQVTLFDYRDKWDEIEDLLVKQRPVWTPGTKYSYHAMTYGMYVDALVRKVDPLHRNITQFFEEEIADPFDLDLHIGLPLTEFHRSTRCSFTSMMTIGMFKFFLQPRMWKWIPEVLFGSILQGSINTFDFMEDLDLMNDAERRSVGLASAVGFGNARSLAKFYDFLANNGSVSGKQLLSSRQVTALRTPVTEGIPVIASPDQNFAMGTMIDDFLLGHRVFGHGGYGGQLGMADECHGIAVGYTTNFNTRHGDSLDPRAMSLLKVVYKHLHTYKERPDDKK